MLRPEYLLVVILMLFSPAMGVSQDPDGTQLKAQILAAWNSVLEKVKAESSEVRIEFHRAVTPNAFRLVRVDNDRFIFKHGAGVLSFSDVDDVAENMAITKRSTDIQITNRQYTAQLQRP